MPAFNPKKAEIQDKVLAAVEGKQVAGAAVSMGVGKTMIGLRDMDRILDGGRRLTATMGKIFAVVAPKVSIHHSWKDDATDRGLSYLLDHIHFVTYASLPKFLAKFGHLIHKIYLDECHSLKESHRQVLEAHLARNKPILGLTGSKPKHQKSEKGKLVARFCPIVIDYSTDEAVEDGILNDYRIIVHGLRLSPVKDLKIQFKSGGTRTSSELETYQYWSNRLFIAEDPTHPDHDKEKMRPDMLRIQRMQAMMKFPSKGRYLRQLQEQFQQKVIIFVNNKEQVAELIEYVNSDDSQDLTAGGYYSGLKISEQNLKRFNAGELSRLICVAQLSEGINIPDLRYGIIWHAFGNERKASQRIGRMLRLNPDSMATVHVLMYLDTVDETWVHKALEKFDSGKIIYIQHEF